MAEKPPRQPATDPILTAHTNSPVATSSSRRRPRADPDAPLRRAPLQATPLPLYLESANDPTRRPADKPARRARRGPPIAENGVAPARPGRVRRRDLGTIRLRWGRLDLAAGGVPAIVIALVIAAAIAVKLFR
jgi:hypothetical protein